MEFSTSAENVTRLAALIKQDGKIVKIGWTTCTVSVAARATTELDCAKSSGSTNYWEVTAPLSRLQF